MAQVTEIVKNPTTGGIEFKDASSNIVAVLTSAAHARPVGLQGIEITDATGFKITVFANVLTQIDSPTGGTVVAPITQQQLLGELATNFFRA